MVLHTLLQNNPHSPQKFLLEFVLQKYLKLV